MDVAKTADVASRPAGAMPCPLAGSIQDRCDRQIGQLPRQVANEIDNISLNCPAGLADLVFLHRHPGVIATLPMNDERQCVVNGIDNDFFDQQPNDLFALDASGPVPCLTIDRYRASSILYGRRPIKQACYGRREHLELDLEITQ